jgi:mono/diheme cytochrome c family protein
MFLARVNGGRIRIAAMCLVLLVGVIQFAPRSHAWTAQQDAPAPDGRELFRTYCASCHGAAGAGNGPVAASMRRTPPDITGIALANGGVFPTDRMRRIIDGRDIEAHGDRDMPVWGDAFKAVRGGRSEESVRERLASILQYLISIQRRLA